MIRREGEEAMLNGMIRALLLGSSTTKYQVRSTLRSTEYLRDTAATK